MENPCQAEPAGIYVHIPFCVWKCPYCDFYSITDMSLKEAFLGALLDEMQIGKETGFFQKTRFSYDTLYIGGGTPSVLDAEQISRIIEAACRSFQILSDAEITIEVNPGTVTPEQLRGYRHAGVNRINIGVQSFQDANLKFLGRIHSAQNAHLAIRQARDAGFENLGLDLIYGIPGQSEKSWLADLHRAVAYRPEHLSCYMLTFESGTQMDDDRKKGRFCPADEALTARLFETTISFLEDHGYAQYEISNFARSVSKRSRHNQKYWTDAPYRGLGPSAHSFAAPERCWNCRSVKKYMETLSAGKLPIEKKETLTREQRILETIYAGLRKTDGIDIDNFNKRFSANFEKMFGEAITPLEKEGLIQRTQNRCLLSRRGMLFLDSIASILV